MSILLIDACPRGRGLSRTLALADAFLDALGTTDGIPDISIQNLSALRLIPLDGETLARREALIDAAAWDDPLFAVAREFAVADSLVVAAPYWDLMFPASLKTYIEHVFIREMTFAYRDDTPIGLCRARRALFLTTAGGMIGEHDFGAAYLRAALAFLGVKRFDCVRAEGIDMLGADTDAILEKAAKEAETIAKKWGFLPHGKA